MSTQIAEFLSGLGLSQHIEAFVANDLDMDLLPTLMEADLRELGIDKLGHRKRLLAAIKALYGNENAATDSTARVQRRLLTLMFADLVGSTMREELLRHDAIRLLRKISFALWTSRLC